MAPTLTVVSADPSATQPGARERAKTFDLGGADLRAFSWPAVVAVAGGGVLLGIAAAVAARKLPERAAEGGSVPLDVINPQIVDVFVWGTVVVAIAIVLFAFWPDGRRRRRRPDRPPRSLARMLIGLAVIIALLYAMRPILPDETAEPEQQQEVVPQEVEETGARPAWAFALLAGALVAALGGLAAVGMRSMLFGSEAPSLPNGFRAIARGSDVEDQTSGRSRGTEVDVGEPRRAAIVRDYGGMLTALGAAGHVRRSSEAPEEYVRRIGRRTTAADPARELTELFEIAAFSERQTTDEMVAGADTALEAVRRALGREQQ